jgi:hypothetical protein
MTPTTELTAEPEAAADLATAIQRVLAASAEPLTVSKIRARLSAPFSSASSAELADFLQRQVAANVLYAFPRYRSQHDRFWDRPMAVHIASLIHVTLENGALPLSQLRRKLPPYAQSQADEVLNLQVGQGLLHRHPRKGSRGGDLFGVHPADPKDYLSGTLAEVFADLERLGFTEPQLRAAALELLHDEEWSPARTETTRPEERSRAESRTSSPVDSPESRQTAESPEAGLEQSETHPDAPDLLSHPEDQHA